MSSSSNRCNAVVVVVVKRLEIPRRKVSWTWRKKEFAAAEGSGAGFPVLHIYYIVVYAKRRDNEEEDKGEYLT